MAPNRESTKVFVAQIPHATSEGKVYAAFENFGPIVQLNMLYRQDGSSRGCAFITYASDRSARKCLILNGQTVFSHETLVVRAAEDKRSYQKKKDVNRFHVPSQARLPDQFQRSNSLAQSGISNSHYSAMDSNNKITCDGMKIPMESRPTCGAAITRPNPPFSLFPGSSDTDRRATYGPSAQTQASQKLHLPTDYNRGLVPYTNTLNGSGLGGTAGGGTHFVGGAIVSADLQISESVPIMNNSSSHYMGGHPMHTTMHTQTTGTSDGYTATTGTSDGHTVGIQPKDYPIHQAWQQQQHFQTKYERQQQTQELLFGTAAEGNGDERHNDQHQHEHQHQHVFSSHDANINNTNININNTNINVTMNGINGALNGLNSSPSRFNGKPKNDNDVCVVGGGVDPIVDLSPSRNPHCRGFTTGHGFVGNQRTSSNAEQFGEIRGYNPFCAPEIKIFGTQNGEWQNGILKPSWSMGAPLGKCTDYKTDAVVEETKKVAEVGVSDDKTDSKPFKWTTGNLPTRFGFIHFEQPPMEGEAVSKIVDDKRLKPCTSFWL